MSHRLQLSVFAAIALSAGVEQGRAAVIYATGFENPSFNANQILPGQNGWTATSYGSNAAIISTASPASGIQAVRVSGASLSDGGQGFSVGSYRKVVDYNPWATGQLLVRIEVDARITGPATTDDFATARLQAVSNLGVLGDIAVATNGIIYAGSDWPQPPFQLAGNAASYNHLQLDLNYRARTITFSANGQIFGSLPFNASVSDLNRSTLLMFADNSPLNAKASYQAHFDNFSISSSVLPTSPVFQSSLPHTLVAPEGFAALNVSNITGHPGQWGGFGVDAQGSERALIWSGPSGTVVDLHPNSLGPFTGSRVANQNGVHQVGFAVDASESRHAILWNGTAASAVDLSPTNLTGIEDSAVLGISSSGNQQVGEGGSTGLGAIPHALLWQGSANSAVDLHPTTLAHMSYGSKAFGTDGVQQVGEGYTSEGRFHALLWQGSAGSALDLHPTNLSYFSDSSAEGVHGNQQVGAAGNAANNVIHAMLWNGTADSAVDLNPTNLYGINSSIARSTNGASQAGTGSGPGTSYANHALTWSGTADSAVDLHLTLPTGFASSEADWIDAQGKVYGEAVDSQGIIRAVVWSPPLDFLEADFDQDHSVDADDLAAWRQGFGIASSATRAHGDADGDQDVDAADFLVWQRQLGTTPAYSAAIRIPEPTAGAVLLIVGVLAAAGRTSRFSFRCGRDWHRSVGSSGIA